MLVETWLFIACNTAFYAIILVCIVDRQLGTHQNNNDWNLERTMVCFDVNITLHDLIQFIQMSTM